MAVESEIWFLGLEREGQNILGGGVATCSVCRGWAGGMAYGGEDANTFE